MDTREPGRLPLQGNDLAKEMADFFSCRVCLIIFYLSIMI